MSEFMVSALNDIPGILVWTGGTIIGILMIRRGGNTPAKLFLAGCILQLIASIAGPFVHSFASDWVRESDLPLTTMAGKLAMINLPVGLISLAGFICLLSAFWKKFITRGQEEV